MLRRFVLALAALSLPASTLPAQEARAASVPEVERLFATALTDPAAIVPLLVEGSRLMPTLQPDDARRLGDSLEPFARRVFFGPEKLQGQERLGLVDHVVAKGDNPTAIAARHDVGHGLLAYLNAGFDARKLRVGQRLKVLDLSRGQLEIEVDRAAYRLAAWRQLPEGGRVLVLFAPIGIGAVDSPTPVGRTQITKRVLDPQWTDPDTKRVYAPDDPGNVLGGYWIALGSEGLGQGGIGIHGYTGAPSDDWLQKPGSRGCVRMLKADIDRVFHLATEGTPVEIR